MDKFKEKVKLIWFFLVGLYSYIHRGFFIYVYAIQGFSNFLTLLLFKHNDVTIKVAGKWDVNVSKAIIYITHFIIALLLYIVI
jgi:hypothetical protein